MSMSLAEHDYIGLSEASKMESSEKSTNNNNSKGDLNLKATELRLGLPGSESPERDSVIKNNNLVSGAKRGFADTINGGSSGNWVFNVNGGGCEVDLSKNGGFLSPKGDNKNSVLGSKENVSVSVSVSASAQDLMEKKSHVSAENGQGAAAAAAPATKAQVVGWPPIRSFRKNTMATNPPKNENVGWPPVRSFRKNAMDTNLPNNDNEVDAKSGSSTCLYVKVSMDGAPYLRKVDLKIYTTYMDLSSALEKMFSCFTIGQYSSPGTPMREGLSESKLMDLLHGSEYVLTYEDKDGDWMLVGDVPWDMFTGSCKRMRIMKSSEAIGLAPRAMEKCRNRN